MFGEITSLTANEHPLVIRISVIEGAAMRLSLQSLVLVLPAKLLHTHAYCYTISQQGFIVLYFVRFFVLLDIFNFFRLFLTHFRYLHEINGMLTHVSHT